MFTVLPKSCTCSAATGVDWRWLSKAQQDYKYHQCCMAVKGIYHDLLTLHDSELYLVCSSVVGGGR